MKSKFLTYLMVGSLVGLSAVGLQSTLASLLPKNNLTYAFTVAVVYPPCTFLSFLLHKNLTFRNYGTADRSLKRYFALTVFAGVAATFLAVTFKAALGRILSHAEFIGSIAFVSAALIVSVVMFYLNSTLVFLEKSRCDR